MNILIADDHTIVREGLKQVLKKMNTKVLIDEAKNGIEAFDKIKKKEYDFIILDISMPGKSGLDVLKSMKDQNINANILILSMHPEEQYAIRAFKLGASGYINKGSLYEELGKAIKTILAGGKYVSPALAEKIIFHAIEGHNKLPHETLSEREFQIMIMLAKGISNKEIAEELFISDKTVSTHRARLLEKMDMKNNAELISYAIKNELIE